MSKQSLVLEKCSEMESISKSPQAEKIPMATVLTVSKADSCAKPVVAEAHSTRDENAERSQYAQDHEDRNSKSKRPCEDHIKKAGCAARGRKTTMDGEVKTISARLRNPEIWDLFHSEETEMIITKAGRRMFPVPDFCLAGLEPNQYYGCAVEVVAVDSSRYRHKSSQGWVPAGKGMPLSQTHNKYLHPNSASLGQYWMREGAIFDKLKLSNHIHQSSGNIVVNSMQKYRLRLVVTKLGMRHCDRWVFNFPETQFITVTSYQNPRMTQLKIDNNPFAKAFREGKRSSRQDSAESKAKKRRTRFPSPPPIVRFQTPFINFLSSQDQAPVNSAVPPPPPPPLTHDWPDEPYATRALPLSNDLPISWERDDTLASSHMLAVPSMNSSFKVELNGTLHWRDTYAFPQSELSAPELDFQPQFPTQCWSAPPTSAFSLYEDAQMHMQPFLSRDQFWRES